MERDELAKIIYAETGDQEPHGQDLKWERAVRAAEAVIAWQAALASSAPRAEPASSNVPEVVESPGAVGGVAFRYGATAEADAAMRKALKETESWRLTTNELHELENGHRCPLCEKPARTPEPVAGSEVAAGTSRDGIPCAGCATDPVGHGYNHFYSPLPTRVLQKDWGDDEASEEEIETARAAANIPMPILDAIDEYGTVCVARKDHGPAWYRLTDAIKAALALKPAVAVAGDGRERDAVALPLPEEMARRALIYQFLERERRYQDAKFGGRPHEIPSWLMLAKSEIAEAEVAWCRADKDEEGARAEVVQACAVLLACLEQHGPAEEAKHTKMHTMNPPTFDALKQVGAS